MKHLADAIYIAGPMTGLPDFNYPAFMEHERLWIERGYEVVNPARFFNGDTTLLHSIYMREAIRTLLAVDAIAMLPGWQNSRGADFEYRMALLLDLRIYDSLSGKPLEMPRQNESILEEAARLTGSDRQDSYGDPANDYAACTGAFNSVTRRTGDRALTPAEGAMFMCCVKLAREGHRPKRDNRTDLAGYAWVLDKIQEKNK